MEKVDKFFNHLSLLTACIIFIICLVTTIEIKTKLSPEQLVSSIITGIQLYGIVFILRKSKL